MSGLPGRLSHAPFPARRWQALADQDGADAVLGGGQALADQQLAVGDQGPPLLRLHRRDDDGRQLAERLRLGQAQGVAPAA